MAVLFVLAMFMSFVSDSSEALGSPNVSDGLWLQCVASAWMH